MKGIYKILIVIVVLIIVIISIILIINNDIIRELQSIEYVEPHYDISKTDNKLVTVEYNQNMWPKIITTYSYTENKLTQREMKFFCKNKQSAKETYESLENNNKYSIEKVTINKNIVISTLSGENILTYEASIANLSVDQVHDFLVDQFEKRGFQRIEE